MELRLVQLPMARSALHVHAKGNEPPSLSRVFSPANRPSVQFGGIKNFTQGILGLKGKEDKQTLKNITVGDVLRLMASFQKGVGYKEPTEFPFALKEFENHRVDADIVMRYYPYGMFHFKYKLCIPGTDKKLDDSEIRPMLLTPLGAKIAKTLLRKDKSGAEKVGLLAFMFYMAESLKQSVHEQWFDRFGTGISEDSKFEKFDKKYDETEYKAWRASFASSEMREQWEAGEYNQPAGH